VLIVATGRTPSRRYVAWALREAGFWVETPKNARSLLSAARRIPSLFLLETESDGRDLEPISSAAREIASGLGIPAISYTAVPRLPHPRVLQSLALTALAFVSDHATRGESGGSAER
jgi:hypothetical protein